jgi:hypothetical protein
VDHNEQITLTAYNNNNYTFRWWDNSSTSATRVITVSSDMTCTAYFVSNAISTYTIKGVASPLEGGTVTGGGPYEAGTWITLTATANKGYIFNKWTDKTVLNSTVSREVRVDGNATYTAEFIKDPNYIDRTTDQIINRTLYIRDTTSSIALNEYKGRTDFDLVDIPNTVTSIGIYAFRGCTNLVSITIPDTITRIDTGAFIECTSLQAAVLGSDLTAIPVSLFQNCENLLTVTIPASVKSIGQAAFYGCKTLTQVCYTGTKAQWEAITIGESNTPLTNASIMYNYVSPYSAEPMMMSARPTMMLADVGGVETYAEEDSGMRAKYKAALYKYHAASGLWSPVASNSKYIYHNDLYNDVVENVLVIAKEDISNRQDINFTVFSKVVGSNGHYSYDNDLMVTKTHFTVFDLNDPVVSDTPPRGAKEGQLWLDTSTSPWTLKIYQNGEWIRFEQQGGKRVFTDINQVLEGYSKGDLWILENSGLCGAYTKGTMLRATHNRTKDELGGKIIPSDWEDAMEAISKLQQDVQQITHNMSFDTTTGLTIGRSNNEAHVTIDSGEVGFYDSNNIKVVHISNQTANIDNLTVDGAAVFASGRIELGSSFALQLEADGSLSLVLAN